MSLNRKEKFDYWWKIIFFIIFCLISATAAVYTLVAFPFNILNVVYFLGEGLAAAGTGFLAYTLLKEYKQKNIEFVSPTAEESKIEQAS